MTIKKLIFALGLLTCAFASMKAMEEKKIEKRKHKIKLSYNNKPLSWRQTTAFLEAKMLKDMIDSDGEEIAIDEIIHNTVHTENIYFKNNILDIINIIPSKALHEENLQKNLNNLPEMPSDLTYDPTKRIDSAMNTIIKKNLDLLQKINTETKESVNNEISKIIKKYCYKDYQENKIMDMIRCAQYIDSPVRNDLIEFAVSNNLIDKKILESVDRTPESLRSIKDTYNDNAEILEILPLNTVNTLIEQRMGSEENIIIDAIKTAYYKTKESEESKWYKTQIDELDQTTKDALKRNDRLNTDPRYTLFNFSNMSLPYKIKFIKKVNNKITEITNDIDTETNNIEKNVKEKKSECLKTFLKTTPGLLLNLVTAELLKKYYYTKESYATSYTVHTVGLMGGSLFTLPILYLSEGTTAFLIKTCVFSPIYQLLALFDLIKSYRANINNYDNNYFINKEYYKADFALGARSHIEKLTDKKNILKHIKTTLEKIIKNEYALKTSKK